MNKKIHARDGALKLGGWTWKSPFRIEQEPEEELTSREEVKKNMTSAEKTQWPGCIKVKFDNDEYLYSNIGKQIEGLAGRIMPKLGKKIAYQEDASMKIILTEDKNTTKKTTRRIQWKKNKK